MRRLGAFALILFLAWSALPTFAGANSITHIDIGCDAVAVSWASFPQRPVDLRVTLEQHGRTYERTVSTDGAPDGARTIPANFDDGPASASVAWTFEKDHYFGPVETVLHCTITTSTTSSTTTSTTTAPSTSTTVTPPTTAPPDECGPDTLACTGASMAVPLMLGGWLLIGVGVAFVVGPKLRRQRRSFGG